MAISRQVEQLTGFGRSNAVTFTIPSGATGAAVAAADLGRGYTWHIVKCEDTTGIDAATGLTMKVGYDNDDTLCDLYATNDPATKWTKSPLPDGAGATLAFPMFDACGAQRLQLILSKVTTAAVTFKIYGFDPTVDDRTDI